MAVVGAGFAFSGTQAMTWMETPEFCGRCHTMGPEVAAHENSSHAGVECAECHVGAGVIGLAKAKIGGMRQMAELVLGDYARPIPPAADKMPPASETCERCHDPARERSNLLITKTRFGTDETNTHEQVGLVLRLSNTPVQTTEGIHWHVLSNVTYATDGENSDDTAAISWVGVDKADGTHEEFIAANAVTMAAQAKERAAEIRATSSVQQMSCYDCHNRVGHDFPTPDQAMDPGHGRKADRSRDSLHQEEWHGTRYAAYDSMDAFDRSLRDLERYYVRDYPYLYIERPTQ